jgi:hypothetical protein
MSTKKYILKPGKHQFAPGSAAIHDNDNLTDEEAAWYLKAYPHIKALFTTILESNDSMQQQPVKSFIISETPTYEDLSTTN